MRNKWQVVGGITYRAFHAQRMAEIAFCAVAQSLQVSGFGTRLMNWTKVGEGGGVESVGGRGGELNVQRSGEEGWVAASCSARVNSRAPTHTHTYTPCPPPTHTPSHAALCARARQH